MLISHKHRFIFVKTRKTASTSVEIVLSRFCDGESDVITPVLRRDEQFQEIAGVTAKNYQDVNGKRIFYGHHPASGIRNLVGKAIWSSYSTICVVRNPWSRVLSQFLFRLGTTEPSGGFEEFVREEKFTDESEMYLSEGRSLVDHFLRFETIRDELMQLMRYLNLDWDGWLPNANSPHRPPRYHYSEAYTPELVAIVGRRCAWEIKHFGYEFEAVGSAVSTSPPHLSAGLLDELSRNSGNTHPRSFDVNVLADNHCRPVRASNIRELRLDNGLVLQNVGDARAHGLDDYAERIWHMCDGNRTVDEMFSALQSRFSAPQGLLSTDLLVTLDRMKALGQIEAPDLHGVFGGKRRVLDLRSIKFYVITCGGEKRKTFMTEQLERLGLDYEFVEAVRASRKKLSISLSHLNILRLNDLKVPFAVLEDDCQFVDGFQYEYDLPAETDALYLGTSGFGSKIPGRLSTAVWRNVRFVNFDSDHLRVFNMFGRHAIVYVSQMFKASAVESVSDGILRLGIRFAGDAYYAMLHASHLVLTPSQPVCFQNGELGGQQGATRGSLGSIHSP